MATKVPNPIKEAIKEAQDIEDANAVKAMEKALEKASVPAAIFKDAVFEGKVVFKDSVVFEGDVIFHKELPTYKRRLIRVEASAVVEEPVKEIEEIKPVKKKRSCKKK